MRNDILGGAATFVAMAYIIIVNPAILKAAGLPVGASTVATIVVAAAGSILMGIYAKRPIAVAPYMGENAFIAYGLAALGITWQQRIGSVFVSGVLFLIITLIGLRGWLAKSISQSLKFSFAAGIGLFLTFIGLTETGIVESGTGVPVKIGNLHNPQVLLAIGGFIVMMTLMCLRVRGAILIGIIVTAIAGIFLGYGHAPNAILSMPFTGDYSLAPIALQLDIRGVLRLSFLPILLTLFLMSFLDTLGTLVGVGAAGGMLDAKGNFPEIEKPMTVDAISCCLSGLLGTSTSGAYIESAVGIREGATTGMAAITTGLLFALSLFFIPLVEPLQALRFAYGPALIVVGAMMLESIRRIDFDDLTELVPAFATIVMMIFTYNIANGLTAGLVLYPLMKLLAGRPREIGGGSIVLAALCLVWYVFGLPH
ncbi:MAG: NCS2 family permease [Acidobacteria bacterium]|nr:NCS2 family permease [Acidobacteriota bacterium]MBV9071242.1 NCS2 family permease [Acidobacteriota bacterium]